MRDWWDSRPLGRPADLRHRENRLSPRRTTAGADQPRQRSHRKTASASNGTVLVCQIEADGYFVRARIAWCATKGRD
jgi:hypothetical protein